jgi:hypothetical protein
MNEECTSPAIEKEPKYYVCVSGDDMQLNATVQGYWMAQRCMNSMLDLCVSHSRITIVCEKL